MRANIKLFIIGFISSFVSLGLPSFFNKGPVVANVIARIVPVGILGTLITGLIYSAATSLIFCVILFYARASNIKLRALYFGLGFYAFYVLSFAGFLIFINPSFI